MTAANPVSPKAKAAGFGAAALPIIAGTVVTLIDMFNQSDIVDDLDPAWGYPITVLIAVIGALAGAYRARDGLRLPTLDQAEVDKLNDPEPKPAE